MSLLPQTRRDVDALLRPVAVILMTLFAIGLAWQLAIIGFRLPPYIIPSPLAVLGSFIGNARVIALQTALTLGSALAGLALSTVLSAIMAAAFTVRPRLAQAAMPAIIAIRSAPVVAVAPIIMLVLGRGVMTSIVVVTIVSFFPLLIGLMRGLKAADRNAMELLHVYNASIWQGITLVRLPFALPFFFTGLRIAAAGAILGAMLSEWITGSRGLGNLILDSGEMRETELLWAAVMTSIIAGLLAFAATSSTERRLTRWRQ
jgi:ABC-type nitrate/sulfonate/bicarbonate transport system permease component